MADSVDTKSVRVPTIGKTKDAHIWLLCFMAFAVAAKIVKSVQSTGPHPDLPDSESEVLVAGTDDKKIAAKEENQKAYSYLTMAFTSNKFIGLLMKARTTEWPNGLAWKVMEGFVKKFKPDDQVSGIEVQQKLDALRFKKKDDPEDFFKEIDVILNSTPKVDVKQEQLIALVMKNAPKMYLSVISAEQREKKDQLTLEILAEAMHDHYCLTKCNKGTSGEEDSDLEEEAALAVTFTGKCYRCHQPGHRAANCPNRSNNNNNSNHRQRFSGNCNLCGKYGHKEADCWEKPENASKRPREWRSTRGGGGGGGNQETAAAAASESDHSSYGWKC